MEPFYSASSQKTNKISIESDSSSQYGSPKNQAEERFSTWPDLEDLNNLISIIKKTLSGYLDLPELPATPNSLKFFIEVLCKEFEKTKTREILLKNSSKQNEDISVNILNVSQKDPLKRVFSMPDQGIWLSKNDCKNISGLLVGALRDSSSHSLQSRISELQEKVIALSEANRKLKRENKELRQNNEELQAETTVKTFEIDDLIEQVESLEKKLGY